MGSIPIQYIIHGAPKKQCEYAKEHYEIVQGFTVAKDGRFKDDLIRLIATAHNYGCDVTAGPPVSSQNPPAFMLINGFPNDVFLDLVVPMEEDRGREFSQNYSMLTNESEGAITLSAVYSGHATDQSSIVIADMEDIAMITKSAAEGPFSEELLLKYEIRLKQIIHEQGFYLNM